VLAGRLTWDDEAVKTHPGLINIQDHVSQIGQGRVQDRTHERLGRSDIALLLYRRIFARELRALAGGQPLKAWRKPERLQVTAGVE
jgi:5,5'-dehydrodivanillate O-demethylase